jgi:hypothetical protein
MREEEGSAYTRQKHQQGHMENARVSLPILRVTA